MKIVFLFGFFPAVVIAFGAAISQQEFLAWAGTLAAGVSLFVMAMIPLYLKVAEAVRHARAADRESRRADCEEQLQRQRGINEDLNQRVKSLERECGEWKDLRNAGSKDWPKLE